MGPYSAGTIFLDVLPAFDKFHEAVRRDARETAKNWGEAFGEESEKASADAGKRSGASFGNEFNRAAATSTSSAGQKAADNFSGSFRQAMRSQTQAALKSLGEDVDKGFKDIRRNLDSLRDAKIGLDVDAEDVLADLASIEAALEALVRDDTSIEVKFNAAVAARELAAFRSAVERAAGTVELNVKIGGAFEKTIQSRVRAMLETLPHFELEADTTEAQLEIELVRERLEKLRDAEIGIDLDPAQAMAEINAIEAALEALANDTDVDVRIHFDTVRALAAAKALREEIEGTFSSPADFDVNIRAGGAFEEALRQRIRAALSKLPDVDINVDINDVEHEIVNIRRELAQLADADIGVDVDVRDALLKIQELRLRIHALEGEDPNIDVDVNLKEALAELTAFGAYVRTISGQEINIDVDVDTSRLGRVWAILRNVHAGGMEATNSFRTFNGVLLAAVALGPLLIPVLASIAAGVAALGAAAVGVGAGLGILILSFTGIIDAVKAMGDVEKNAAKDAEQAARTIRTASNSVRDAEEQVTRARVNAAQAAEDASRRVADAQENVTRAEEAAAEAAESAARRVEDAERSLERARRDGAEAVKDARDRVTEAAKAVKDAEEDAAEAVEDAIKRRDDARKDYLRTVESGARAVEQATQREADAEHALTRARRDRARSEEQNSRQIADARKNLERVQTQTASSVERAIQQQTNAERRYADTQKAATRAQQDLLAARKEAAEYLEDLAYRRREGDLNEREAVLALADAEREYNRVNSREFKSARSVEEVTVAYENAKLALERIRSSNARLADEQTRSSAEGVDGNERVLSAQEALDEAIRNQADAEEARAQAGRDVAAAQVKAAEDIVEAEQRVTDAIQAQTDEALDRAERVSDAEQRLEEARDARALAERDRVDRNKAAYDAWRETVKAVNEAREDGQKRVEDAEKALEDARDARADAVRDRNERIADAERDLATAVEAQAQQQRDSLQSVEDARRGVEEAQRAQQRAIEQGQQGVGDAQQNLIDAQANYQDALTRTEEIGSGSMQKLRDAMSKLGPEGQEFAKWLFSLRGGFYELRNVAQAGILPGVQEALQGIIDKYGPSFLKFVGEMSKVIGDLFRDFGEMLQNPVFEEIFDTFGKMAPDFMRIWGTIFLNLLQGFGALAEAFAPFALDFSNAILGLTEDFSKWASTLEDTDGFKDFLGYIERVGPKVWDLLVNVGDALVNIGVGLAPYADMLLDVVSGFFGFLGDVDPKLLGDIAFALLAVVVAIQLGAAAMTLFNIVSTAFAVSNPIGLIVASIVLVGAAVIALWKNSETFRNVMIYLGDVVTVIWKGIVETVKFAVDAIMFVWNGGIGDGIISAFKAVYDFIVWVFDELVFHSIIPDAVKLIVWWFEWMWTPIRVIWDIYEFYIRHIIAPVMLWLWKDVVAPALKGIWEIVQFMWHNVVKPIWNAFDDFLRNILGPTLSWLWNNIVVPVANGIGTAFSSMWSNVVKPVWDAFYSALGKDDKTGLRGILNALDLLAGLVAGTIGTAFSTMWTLVVEPVWDAFADAIGLDGKSGLRAILNALDSLVDSVMKAMGTIINTTWNEVIEPIWNSMKKALGLDGESGLRGAFKTATNAIGELWGKLRGFFSEPVYILLDTVINDGIIKAFNWLAKKLPGIDEIDPVPIPDFLRPKTRQNPGGWTEALAGGGIVPGYTPGQDVHTFFSPTAGTLHLSGGEGILVPELTAELGPEWIDYANFKARAGGRQGAREALGGFAAGGVLPSQSFFGGGIFDKIRGAVSGAKDFGKDFVLGNLRGAAESMLGPIIKKLELIPGIMGEVVRGFAKEVTGSLFNFAGASDAANADDSATPNGNGGLGPVANAARDFVFSEWADDGISSIGGYANRNIAGTNMKSKHALGKAIDIMIPDYRSRDGIALGNEIANWFVANPGRFHTDNVIWRDHIWNSPRGWHPYGHPGGVYNDTTQHRDHVHMDVYDDGGILAPGIHQLMNLSGKPEAVFNNDQWKTIERIADRGMSDGGLTIGQLVTANPDEAVRKIRMSQQDAAAMANLQAIVRSS